MQYARLPSGREIKACDLSNGSIRSNDYVCIFCFQKVTYVSRSERAKPHFRHKTDESCISACDRKELEEQAELRTCNRKTKFHTWWQSLFNSENIEVCIKSNESAHIADIYVSSMFNIQVKLDSEDNMFNESKPELVIEVQHSNITAKDVKSRSLLYNNNKRNLLWIVDISHIVHIVDRFVTMTQDTYKIIFTKQHYGLGNIVKNHGSSTILFDNGSYLYKVNDCCLDIGYTYVSPISKSSFLSQLKDQGINIMTPSINEGNTYNLRNYKTYIESLELKVQVDVDEIINMIEDIPIIKLRESQALYASHAYESYIHMVVEWLGIKSNGDKIVLKMIQKWLEHLKKYYYSQDIIQFGKYKDTKLCDLPQSYIKWALENNVFKNNPGIDKQLFELRQMDIWFIHHWFKNPKKLCHYPRCRRYYRINWDKRRCSQRMNILESLLERPWLNLYKEVTLDCDRMVRSIDYEPVKFLDTVYCTDSPVYCTDSPFIYAYYPVKYKGKYIAIDKEDLLISYGEFDEEHKMNDVPKIEGYAFLDD